MVVCTTSISGVSRISSPVCYPGRILRILVHSIRLNSKCTLATIHSTFAIPAQSGFGHLTSQVEDVSLVADDGHLVVPTVVNAILAPYVPH